MLLEKIAQESNGVVCDFGCGPGHVGEFIRTFGRKVCGLDISLEMLAQGRARYPEIDFIEADFRELPFEDHTFGGGVAFYSLIHLLDPDFPPILEEIRRVLRPGAPFSAAFHLGDGSLHVDEFWGSQISLDYKFYTPEELCAFFEGAGFKVAEVFIRKPYEGFEHPSQRCYIVGRA